MPVLVLALQAATLLKLAHARKIAGFDVCIVQIQEFEYLEQEEAELMLTRCKRGLQVIDEMSIIAQRSGRPCFW